MRKHYPICDCSGDWCEDAGAICDDDVSMAWAYMTGWDRRCPQCSMYFWGDAYNDNAMRDLQEMNQ